MRAGPLLLGLGGLGGLAVAGVLLVTRRPARAAVRTSALPAPSPSPSISRPAPAPAEPRILTSPMPGGPAEVNALARVISSELERGQLVERLAIAYTVVNRARKEGRSIFDLVGRSGWGEQGPVRPFSSDQPATPRSLALATWVLAYPRGAPVGATHEELRRELRSIDPRATGAELDAAAIFLTRNPGGDPVGGGTAFWEPGVQDDYTAKGILYRAGGGRADDKTPQGSRPELFRFRRYKRSAAAIRAKWTGEGQRLLESIGRLELWR